MLGNPCVHHHGPRGIVTKVVGANNVLEGDGDVAPAEGRVQVHIDRVDIGEGDFLQVSYILLYSKRELDCQESLVFSTLKKES